VCVAQKEEKAVAGRPTDIESADLSVPAEPASSASLRKRTDFKAKRMINRP
jgi:hypothetical protein